MSPVVSEHSGSAGISPPLSSPFALILLLLVCAPTVGRAQGGTALSDTASPDSALATLERGVEAVKQKRYDVAYAHLAPLTTLLDSLHHPTHGSPARWLGRAFYEQGRTRQARIVWAEGVRRAREASHTAVGAADALIRTIQNESNPVLALLGFDHILDALGQPVADAEEEVLRRHAAQLALITPDSITQPLTALAEGHRSSAEISVGPDLREWFRRRDPILATAENERLREHVVRVHTARERYGWDRRSSGLDDRGETYVRLGPPSRRDSVSVEDTLPVSRLGGAKGKSVSIPSLHELVRFGPIPEDPLMQDNEVWAYPELSPFTHYVFVQKHKPGDPYLISSAQEILNSLLQSPPGRADVMYSPTVHFAIRLSLYNQLRPFAPEYGRRYMNLQTYSPAFDGRPREFVMSEMLFNREGSDWLAEDRKDRTPKQQTTAQPGAPSLPVTVRTARFLNEDRTTRTEIYWSARSDSLVPSDDWIRKALEQGHEPSGNYVLKTTGVLHTSSSYPDVKGRTTDTISVNTVTDHDRLPSRSLILDGPASSGRLSLEWIQNTLTRQDATGALVHVTRKDLTARALPSTASELVMSDLRLLRVPEEGPAVPSSAAKTRRRVLPFDHIPANQKIAVNFELYNLMLGADDRTRYTVEYSTERVQDKDGLAGLLGFTEAKRTSTESTIEGTKRRTQEYTILDLTEMSTLSDPRPVTITVRATDERTGQTVERSLSFTLVPPEE